MARTKHGLPGIYNLSTITLSDEEGSALGLDASGNVKVTLATAISLLVGGTETDTIGVAPFRRGDAFQATITSADAQAATQVKAKTSAKKIYITDLIISTDTAMNIQLQDDAGGPEVLMEQIYVPANSVFSKTFSTPLLVATNQDLDVIASASGNISVTVTGYVI